MPVQQTDDFQDQRPGQDLVSIASLPGKAMDFGMEAAAIQPVNFPIKDLCLATLQGLADEWREHDRVDHLEAGVRGYVHHWFQFVTENYLSTVTAQRLSSPACFSQVHDSRYGLCAGQLDDGFEIVALTFDVRSAGSLFEFRSMSPDGRQAAAGVVQHTRGSILGFDQAEAGSLQQSFIPA